MTAVAREVTTTTPDPPDGMELVRMQATVEPVFVPGELDPYAWETVERTYVWAPPAGVP